MFRTALTATKASRVLPPNSASASQWKRVAFAVFLSGVLSCLPTRGQAAGLDCPVMSPGESPIPLSDLQVKLVTSADSVDIANEINDLINKLRIDKPNISYSELTNAVIDSYCPLIANMKTLTSAEKWRRMLKFDAILQQQLTGNTLAPGTLIIAHVPLSPAVYDKLRSQGEKTGQSPAKLMSAILSQAAEK